MNYKVILTFLQILLVLGILSKIICHFNFLRNIKKEYKDMNLLSFFISLSGLIHLWDRFYIISPFFFYSKQGLSESSLKLARKTLIATLLLWVITIVLFGYMIYLRAVLKIKL